MPNTVKDLNMQELAAYYDLTTKLVDIYGTRLRNMPSSAPMYRPTHKKFDNLRKRLEKIEREIERRIETLNIENEGA